MTTGNHIEINFKFLTGTVWPPIGTGLPRSNLPDLGPITADPTNAIVPAVT